MSCKTCHKHTVYTKSDKPPKFAISNGWMIGQIPKSIIHKDIPDILASSLARVRIFGNVYSYSAGAHTSIKGHHVFFIHDPEHVGASFEYLTQAGTAPDMYVMICGRVTPAQRDIIKRRCIINGLDYIAILTWLIDNHPSYHGMQKPHYCPQPVPVGGFEETTNNTDSCENSMPEVENRFEGEEMTFASRNEPTEETGPYKSNKDFAFSYLAGKKPTLLFRNGDCVGGHKLNLVDISPLIFPYGLGGPDKKRTTKVS